MVYSKLKTQNFNVFFAWTSKSAKISLGESKTAITFTRNDKRKKKTQSWPRKNCDFMVLVLKNLMWVPMSNEKQFELDLWNRKPLCVECDGSLWTYLGTKSTRRLKNKNRIWTDEHNKVACLKMNVLFVCLVAESVTKLVQP